MLENSLKTSAPMNPSTRTPMRRETSDKSMTHTRRFSQERCSRDNFTSRLTHAPSAPVLPVESGRLNVNDGVIRASVEQEHRWLAVQLPVEQDHCMDGVEGNSEGSVLLRERSRTEQQTGENYG